MIIYKNYFELDNKDLLSKQYIIYLFTFYNNKHYIGQTINKLYARLTGHLIDSIRDKSNIKISNALKCNERCKVDILHYCNSIEELNLKETEFINKYNTVTKGYNSNYGGDNRKLTIETKNKISDRNKGRKVTEATKIKMRLACINKTLSNEHKKNIGLGNSKKVINIDTGEIFASCEEAASFYKGNAKSLSVSIGLKTRFKEYRFCFVNNIHNDFKSKKQKKIINKTTKKTYNSIKEASVKNNIHYANLTFALSNNTKCKKSYWAYI